MSDDATLVLAFDDVRADLELAGGKGESLSRLAVAGLAVPPGFHVSTLAYRDFVRRGGIDERIVAVASAADPDDSSSLDAAAKEIGELFSGQDVPGPTAEAIRAGYAKLGEDVAVAVRSSATAEDLPGMSFAGQQDTYLNIRGERALLDAVRRCWASLWTARSIGYRARNGIAPDDVALAVVVQEMVPADSAGIMFTRNPTTGSGEQIVVNAAWGLGEAVVGGAVTPDTYLVDRHTWQVSSQVVDKAVRTVRTEGGTRDEPVPEELRRRPVLSEEAAAELARLGRRIEELYGREMDIEWARHDGRFYIVQARPITGERQQAEEWNDSLAGDFLWTCANLGEAIPSVMTPCTWSLVRIFMSEAMSLSSIGGIPISGNVGGRFYLNLSVAFGVGNALGAGAMVRTASEQAFGRIPADVEVPPLPMSRLTVVRETLRSVLPFLGRVRRYQKRLPQLLAEAPARCDRAHGHIDAAETGTQLISLWHNEVEPLFRDTSRMLAAGARMDGAGIVRIRPRLLKLVGEGDANAMLTGLHGGGGALASLGPVLGLGELARGDIDAAEYLRRWGHRCPDEFEISVPRPAEEPGWVDRQLAAIRDGGTDPETLLARQEQARDEAWRRFREHYPRKAADMRSRVDRSAVAARSREAARSEVIRAFWVLRAFVLRAGVLSGHGDDLFFLSADEVLAVLGGDESAIVRVPPRREAYRRYSSLPAYPTLIRGRFDPARWAADPDRRGDIYDATADRAPVSDAITGFSGAAGVVDGIARVITSSADAESLRPGEILVTTVTNIGWTPLFPRAAAVVTDVGAPLSHAAIVARELGIPAVVGTGNATARLHTGDRIRVDGERGVVELLAG